MQLRGNETDYGQLPDFIDTETGYFFDIYFEEDDPGEFHYETRWVPNTDNLLRIAQHFKVSFVQEYEATGCQVYGRATYENGMLDDTFLNNEDFDAYLYDDETGDYYFEGDTYESDVQILETLLERKLALRKP